jgi:putative thiazole-containing bacteriocin maturation protein
LTNLTPSMRLKVKRDTFFLPDSHNGVYFRNNISSFRMEGTSIDKWVEKLIPMFNGEYSLSDITKGLTGPYRDRVYEIAGALYQNGYVRDVSQDRPHQLDNHVLKRYASQIEFLNSFGDSGAYRFQRYREAKVLAIGSGPILVSLVSALIESGLPKINILITDSVPTNSRRLIELEEQARKTDPEVTVKKITYKDKVGSSWQEIVKLFDSILYVSGGGNVEELRALHRLCREERKIFLPAISLQNVGFAGPLVHPDSKGCWESAWRRIHQTALDKDMQMDAKSSVAEAVLANVIVFEWFKQVSSETEIEQSNQFYLLDFNTMEGNWHSFIAHPLITGEISAERVNDIEQRFENDFRKDNQSDLLLFFNQLTSIDSGIFHIWDEDDLKQLPLAQCYVQVVDLMSHGPAKLLPKQICSGLTHQEARRESGLAGIEAYATQMAHSLFTPPFQNQMIDRNVEMENFFGVGAGETFAEGVCRGLQRCLDEDLKKQSLSLKISASPVNLSVVEDNRCRFYLQALTTMKGAPIIAVGEEVNGFPVVWLGINGLWHGSVGLNFTLALRQVAQQALMKVQNSTTSQTIQALEVSSIHLEKMAPLSIEIRSNEETTQNEILQVALEILKKKHKQIVVYELELEPIFKEELAGVFGVCLREEESM